MKKYIFFLIFFLSGNVFLVASSLQAYLSYAVFNTPENKPYVETYLVINSNSLKYAALEEGGYRGALDIQILFSLGDSIVNFGKYELTGPVVSDTNNLKENILDVQRYALPQGNYILEFSIKDQNSDQAAIVNSVDLAVNFPENEVDFSDVEFLHTYQKSDNESVFTKSGFELIPYVFNFFPTGIDELSFYAEIYNSKKVVGDSQFLLYYYIRPFEVEKKLDQFFYMKKMEANSIVPLLNSIEIKKLPSGNYLFVVETRDRNNNLLAQKETFFQRENLNVQLNMNSLLVSNTDNSFVSKITSRDSLVKYIDYLYPISTDYEKTFAKSIVKNDSLEILQRYFLSFWEERNSVDPEVAWEDYHMLVKQANYEFKTLKIPGYKTDRGRVYLQYGQPNNIAKSYLEPSAYPYEIWQYYELQGQHNKKFVFYTRDIATNDFQLVHSDAVGELANYRWQRVIFQRTTDPYAIDDYYVPQYYGSYSRDYYIQPR